MYAKNFLGDSIIRNPANCSANDIYEFRVPQMMKAICDFKSASRYGSWFTKVAELTKKI